MRYRLLGRSGLRVSELCLGAMTFGQEWGFGSDRAEARAVFDAFAAAGGNFIDTANRYTEGTSEKWCGEFVASERERFVIATKYTLSMRDDDPNASGNQRKNLVQALEASLRRLGTDYVDLLWVHAWDGLTPVAEIMRALDDQVRQGKVLYVGISDTPAWRIAQANTLAELRGWTPFVALQLKYSLLERTCERDLIPMAQALDLAVTTWGSLGGGLLAGKYLRDGSDKPRVAGEVDSKREGIAAQQDARAADIARTVVAIGTELACTPSQVALAWICRQQRAVTIPIIGARTVKQLEENLACLDVEFTTEQSDRLAAASQIELGFPHEFLGKPEIRRYLYGENFERIVDHRGLVG